MGGVVATETCGAVTGAGGPDVVVAGGDVVAVVVVTGGDVVVVERVRS
ncbi:MAG TPA: hypothetical protein VMU76_04370 [Acidimicrobiales bacterium]|nr:hypothetical protein [Acidimicrobiales bacterium]